MQLLPGRPAVQLPVKGHELLSYCAVFMAAATLAFACGRVHRAFQQQAQDIRHELSTTP